MFSDLNPLYTAWVAGLVDGEGSFVMGCALRSYKGRYQSFTFSPVVVVKMHYREAAHLDELHQSLGIGRRYHIDDARGTAGESWQTTSTWEAFALSALLLPYLRIKQRQAQVVIRACFLLDRWAADGGYNGDADRLWELLQIRDALNPGSYRSRQRNEWTRAEVDAIVARQIAGGRDGSRGRSCRLTITDEHLDLLPADLRRHYVSS